MLYVPRADRKCARLVYGFASNHAFSGLLSCGADVRFRRWGKIESKLRPRAVALRAHRFIAGIDRVVTGAVNVLSSLLKPISPFRRLNGALTLYREKFLNRIGAQTAGSDFDEFVMECFLAGEKPGRVLLELWNGSKLAFRESIALQPGENFVTLTATRLLGNVNWPHARLLLYPENDAELRLIFSWLDFVKYRNGAKSEATPNSTPAAKVKCVAWDLDNTLWAGTLVEDGAEKLALRPGVADLIRQLDGRGILQTVVSKNDFELAWSVVKQFGLADYFLFPAINWGAKSANLRQVAEHLNIGLDTFALVDDSAFERGEVQSALPMVRVFSEKQLNGLLACPEFDVPVTEMSRARRASYLTESQRTEARQMFPGDYTEFLRSCGMKLRIFIPQREADVRRCLELVQRSNQLNLSSRRYSAEEFETLLRTPGVLCVALECADKFGSHGLVGFVSVDEREALPCVTNLVLSCRVAQKRVEHAFFGWLAGRERGRGCEKLLADLVITSRNGPLVAVFDNLKFQKVREDGDKILLVLPLSGLPLAEQDVVSVTMEVA
jgi:FkbH-like protein